MDYYSFIIDEKKVGYYETEIKGGIYYQNALLVMQGNQVQSEFWVKLVDNKMVSFKYDDSDWVEITKFPENSYPTCALTLLAKEIKDGATLEYQQINEGKNEVTGKAQLKRTGKKVEETVNGKVSRYLIYNDNNEIVEFGWGGTAKSVKVKDKASATLDTAFRE